MTENNTDNIFSMAPEDWFLPDSMVFNSSQLLSSWPWKNINYYQWYDLYSGIIASSPVKSVSISTTTQTFAILGFIGSICSLLTVYYSWRFESKLNNFEGTIAGTGVSDISFCFFAITRFPIVATKLPGVTIYYSLAAGIAYASSMMSDMLTLCLAIDRYVALSFPIFYKAEAKRFRRWGWISMTLISFLLSTTRLHFCFDNLYYVNFDLQKTTWFPAMEFFSDMIMPFIMCGLMIPLGLVTGTSILKHQKQQKALIGSSPTVAQELTKKSLQNISLLGTLVVIYLINQVGYVVMRLLFSSLAKRD